MNIKKQYLRYLVLVFISTTWHFCPAMEQTKTPPSLQQLTTKKFAQELWDDRGLFPKFQEFKSLADTQQKLVTQARKRNRPQATDL